MSRDGKAHTCAWCGLLGHHRATCHVEAEGRREPDAADRVGCELFMGVRLAARSSTATSRGDVASRIRLMVATNLLVIGPGFGEGGEC